MDKILVTVLGFVSMGFVYWFFLMRKEVAIAVGESVTIVVDGGYSPEVITVAMGKPVTLNFLRKDPSSCLEELVFPTFKIRKFLPVNQNVPLIITPSEVGEFTYSCGMNMFHGKIIVT